MSTAFLYGSRIAGEHGDFRRECSRCPQLLAPTSDRDLCADCEFVLSVKARPDFTFGPACANPTGSPATAYNNYRCRCDTRCLPWYEAVKAQRRAEYRSRRG